MWPACVSAEWLGHWRPLPTEARICVSFTRQNVSGAHPSFCAVDGFSPGSGHPPRTAVSRLAFICSFVSVRRQNISSPCVTVCIMLLSKLALIVRLLSVIFGNGIVL